jgi:hypothetical protein
MQTGLERKNWRGGFLSEGMLVPGKGLEPSHHKDTGS